MDIGEDSIFVYPSGDLKMVQIKTMPYPGFTAVCSSHHPLMLKAHGGLDRIPFILNRFGIFLSCCEWAPDITIENDASLFLHHCDHLQKALVTA